MNFSPYNFKELHGFIWQIRLFAGDEDEKFNEKLKELIVLKSVDEYFKRELTEFCFLTLDNAFFVNAFADYGINSDRGFFPELVRRIKHKLLPANVPDNELSHFIALVFSKRSDYVWVEKINYSGWEALTKLINGQQLQTHSKKLSHQLQNAIIILCHRLTTIGIDPYLVNKLPEIDDSDSPFFELNHQVSLFVKKHFEDQSLLIDHDELKSITAGIDRIERLFIDLQDKKDETGTSLHLTFLLKRAQQHISRIRILLNLFITKEYSNKVLTISCLVTELVKAQHTKNNVMGFVKENTNMLAYRVVSHTSEKGEHYIGFSKGENTKLFRSAMGGGLVVVLLVYIKHCIHHLHLSLFFEGLLFGLNYGLGFVFMYLAHLTLATKQPAMTASYIAESIDNGDNSSKRPWIMFMQIIRSQFVSLIGNLVIVLPLCFILTWVIRIWVHYPVFNPEETKAQLYANHPLYSASLIYACITGVFLSISGLVIGYIDNKVVYSEIPERILKHPKLVKKHSLATREKWASFAERNLGAIIGNLFLGFCLGMAGNIGRFIGIPFDIRHVTISGGNFAIALGSNNHKTYQMDLVITVFVGVLLIGLINIASSFLISFIVACRSRNVSWKQSLRILFGLSK
jgi:site-specific recombinase